MSKILYPILALVSLVVTLYQVAVLRAGSQGPARRALAATLASICLAFTFGAPQVYDAIDKLTGVPNLARLGAHGSATVFSLGMQVLMLYWVYPPAQARRGLRLRLIIWASACAVMLTLFVFGRTAATPYVATRSGDNGFIWAYLTVFSGYLAVALADIMRLCWTYAAKSQAPLLGAGLRLVAAGCAFGLAYSAEKAGYVAGRAVGHELLPATQQEDLSSSIAAISGLLLLTGFATPSLGQQLIAARRCHQLRALWYVIKQAVPEVVLQQRFWDQRARLTRRLVEIHDGRNALGPFMSLDTAIEATKRAEAHELHGHRLAAFVEAAVLLDAAHAKAASQRPTRTYREEPAHADGATELSWAIGVAQAIPPPNKDTRPLIHL